MKKLSLVLALACMSTGAYATKARMLALGESKDDGSFYISDYRNMFRNAAHVNNYANMVFMEWGASAGNALTLDTNEAPKAQGGFVKSAGSFNYGVYLGNESDTIQLLRMTAANSTNLLPASDNVLDVFFGGGDSMKWGVNVVYAKDKNEVTGGTKLNDTSHAVRLGVLKDAIDAFVNISTGNNAKREASGVTTEYKGKLGYHVGGSYQMGNLTPFVSWKQGKWDAKETNVATAAGSFSELQIGAGHTHDVSATSRVFTKVQYFNESVEVKYSGGTAEGKISKVPLTVGFEADATSWLTLRGSVGHNLMGNTEAKKMAQVKNATVRTNVFIPRYGGVDDTKSTIANSTDVNAGATLNFGNLKLDGLIGFGGTSGTVAATGTEKGVLDWDRLLARVGMTYNF